MAGHYHAVIWIDHKWAGVLHINVEEADRTGIKLDHSVGDISQGVKRTGHRIEDDHKYFEAVARAIADAGTILHRRPSGGKKELAKILTERHTAIRTHREGVAALDDPTDGELLDCARRYVKAADRMRPKI